MDQRAKNVPDLAMAEHADPVLRESTRLQVVGHRNSHMPTGASFLWSDLVTFEQDGAELRPIGCVGNVGRG